MDKNDDEDSKKFLKLRCGSTKGLRYVDDLLQCSNNLCKTCLNKRLDHIYPSTVCWEEQKEDVCTSEQNVKNRTQRIIEWLDLVIKIEGTEVEIVNKKYEPEKKQGDMFLHRNLQKRSTIVERTC